MVKIITKYDPPPIPPRQFDWSAVTDDYEPGCPIGWGYTEAEAWWDLVGQLDIGTTIISHFPGFIFHIGGPHARTIP